MTRDEAIKAREEYLKTVFSFDGEWRRTRAVKDIDHYSALGMLKLDEPKPIKLRFCDACVGIGGSATQQIWDNLNAAGLKIVEK